MASFLPYVCKAYCLYGSGILVVVGLLCLLKIAFSHPGPLVNPRLNILANSFSTFKQIGLLLLGQSALLCMTMMLFYFLEIQTQINARLYPLEAGYIIRVLQENPIFLGLLPWCIYSILGVGLAYFSISCERQPLLSRAIILKRKEKMGFFLHNLLSIATDVVTIGPYLFVVSFALVWLCEMVNGLFGLGSLFVTPLRTTFICSLIIVVFQKTNKQLIAWMNQHKVSVGAFLLVYILGFAFFISWLHGFSAWFTLGQEMTSGLVAKSPLAGNFTTESLQTRITFLIWGWWSIWIPWMASLVARTSAGLRITHAFFYAILMPLLLFGWAIHQITLPKYSQIVTTWFKLPAIQLLGVGVLLSFVWLAWGKQRTQGDVSRGVMLPIGRLSKRLLNRWMTILVLWLTCYIPGWFMLGWLPLQVLVTIGGIFMTLAICVFIGTWGSVVFRFSPLHKYKASDLIQ